MGKKAQAAMEFLMTYGWAILIILAVLAVIFNLGIFNPKVQNSCTSAYPITCYDIKLDKNGLVQITLSSSDTSSGVISKIKLTNPLVGECIPNPNSISSSPQSVGCIIVSAVNLGTGAIFEGNVGISYVFPGGTSHNLNIKFIGTVEP